jgi:8-oxo-dGTP pyrophosphatase MutT (NUDIX family)
VPERDFPAGDLGAPAAAWLAGDPGDRGEPAEPRRAATVMLVRDAQGGPSRASAVEVFMLRRVATMAFAPRMWVFPGGGVDPRDDEPDLPWAGPSAAQWAGRLGCDNGLAQALVCAAVREVFEECGVLLAGPTPDTVVADLRDPEWERERAALLAREQSLSQLLLRRRLVLRSDLLSAQGHWLTPEFEPRRYDTWFFAALLPEGQIPDDDTTEADLADWTDPHELLEAYRTGAALLLPPTVVSVETVAAASSAAGFVAMTRTTEPIEPWLVEVDGVPVVRARLP